MEIADPAVNEENKAACQLQIYLINNSWWFKNWPHNFRK